MRRLLTGRGRPLCRSRVVIAQIEGLGEGVKEGGYFDGGGIFVGEGLVRRCRVFVMSCLE